MATTQQTTKPWGRGFSGIAGATTLALSLLGVLPVGPTGAAAQAAEVTPDTCTVIEPATFNATFENAGRPEVKFSGTLHDGTPANACVKIPVHKDLAALAFGNYGALDKDGVSVGTMVVERNLVTFLFNDTFVSTHNSVTFFGEVTFGINRDTSNGYASMIHGGACGG